MFSLASGLLSTLLGVPRDDAAPSVADRLDGIRQAMLDALGHGGDFFLSPLERHVMFAPDAEALWYLRPELLRALARAEGEPAARQKVAAISALFEGLLPSALVAPRLFRAGQAAAAAASALTRP